jgi:hypothetical protein
MKGTQMTARPDPEQPDWLIPAVMAAVGMVLIIALVAFLAVGSKTSEDDRLAGQMERWTTCLRSEGAPVPLVESIGEEGFRVTVDDYVLSAPFDHDSLSVAFDVCLDDAPEGVQTIAAVIEGISSLPFGIEGLEWLGPLLFDLGDSGMFSNPEMNAAPFGDPPLRELCEQLSNFELLPPEVAAELIELCLSVTDV